MPKTSAGMKIKVLDPFQDAKTLWLGLDKPELNQIRKVFQLITPQTVGSKHIMAGITIFPPGKQAPFTTIQNLKKWT